MNNKQLPVTKPYLAPIENFIVHLEKIWETGILTHNGPLLRAFEEAFRSTLNVNSFIAMSNGTVAIEAALRSLNIEGKVITPAFSWIATLSAIQKANCEAVFCDIDPKSLNLDVEKLESLIDKEIKAILPVHTFGNPCDVEKIAEISTKHNIPVIYDAAHAVGTLFKGESILNWGDVSAISLHATKLLNTGEGGGCIAKSTAVQENLKKIRFFGFNEQKEVAQIGFNGKMSEISAALGIANIEYFYEIQIQRKKQYEFYAEHLRDFKHLTLQKIKIPGSNYSYFPVIFQTEAELLKNLSKFNSRGIFPRRYFYPSLNKMKTISAVQSCPISESISNRILCLPLYHTLEEKDQEAVIECLRQ